MGRGRHLLGSQVYDYWSDPWGRVHERWADTDRPQRAQRLEPATGGRGPGQPVGEDPPERFIRHVSLQRDR